MSLAQRPTVELSLLTNLFGTVRLAGRIERFPAALLPGGAAVAQVDGGLVQDRVQASFVRVRNACRHERAAATDTFGIGICILA